MNTNMRITQPLKDNRNIVQMHIITLVTAANSDRFSGKLSWNGNNQKSMPLLWKEEKKATASHPRKNPNHQ
jgi:hypothetical protein